MLPLEGSPLGPLMPEHMSELIAGAILFLIIFVVVWRKVVPVFEKTYAERTAAIQGGMDKAEQAQAEARAALQQYQEQLAGLQGEAAKIREDARNQGARIMAEMRSQAQAESERIVSNAHVQIEAERQQAIGQLRGEVGGLATGLAGKIIGESLQDDERARRTVDRFLTELESGETKAETPA